MKRSGNPTNGESKLAVVLASKVGVVFLWQDTRSGQGLVYSPIFRHLDCFGGWERGER